MLTKKGELIVLASVVIEDIDESMTIFDSENESVADSHKNSNHIDDYSEYRNDGPKIFGVFQHNQVKLVVIVCKTPWQ